MMRAEIKRPPTSSGEATAEGQHEEKQNTQIIPFPGARASERARCVCCGFPFTRRKSESWKTLCFDCWSWNKAMQLMSRATRLLREVR
jgi:hypothetical protein